MDAQWSILLFGIGIFLLALTYVDGEAGWAWARMNLLYGVFGVSTYLVAPLVLYAAVLVAQRRPVAGKTAEAFLLMLLLSGAFLVFSRTDMTGYNLSDGLVALHKSGTAEWGFGGGVISAVFGWSLLALCGRPGANILIVIFLLVGLMLFTGVTPADVYDFFTGRAGQAKNALSQYGQEYAQRSTERAAQRAQRSEQRAAERAEREAALARQQEQQREAQENAEAMRLANSGRSAFDFDKDAYAAALADRTAQIHENSAPRTNSGIDIDLGPEAPEAVTTVTHEEHVDIGPGGTFGQAALRPGYSDSPFVEPDRDFGTIITRKRTATPNAAVPAPSRPGEAAGTAPQAARAAAVAAVNAAGAAGAVNTGTAGGAGAAASAAASLPARSPAPSIDELAEKAAGTPAALGVEENGQTVLVQGEDSAYAYPPLSLFMKSKPEDEQGIKEEMTKNADLLVKTLGSFGVQTRVLDISRGPAVTRYELQPLAGVKISRITGLADDIALNLATTGVRIEAPIPGKAAVGVEIPNKVRSTVSFRSVLESPQFTQSTAPLTFVVGKDIAGQSKVGNLAKMPHLLIAGTTGSGKSVCTNSIIMSFLYRCPPDVLRLILIDPKMVEFSQYDGIPHLLMPVVTEPRKAAGALGSAVAEMEKRYHLLAENGVPNIEEYNLLAEKDESLEKMPYIVIVIDELADLMMVAGKEVEDYICRIAQKARAAGMHLIVATQRPSVDVITGLIKANIPSRIGLSVMSQVDSRTILDTGGAEKLLGNGDMLYMPVGVNKPVRIQGTFIRPAEIKAVIDFIKKHAQADYNQDMIDNMEKFSAAEKSAAGDDAGDEDSSQDPMFKSAVEVVIDAGLASTSLLQRRCKLGYARAARIMDEMEEAHIIGPYEGSKPRQVLISRQQWIEMSMNRTSDADDVR